MSSQGIGVTPYSGTGLNDTPYNGASEPVGGGKDTPYNGSISVAVGDGELVGTP